MKRPALRTGVRWKISIAIAAVGALTAVALSFVVHNAARVSMLENAREVQLDRLTYAQLLYEATKTKKADLRFGAKLNDPTMPRSLRAETSKNRRATHVDESAEGCRTSGRRYRSAMATCSRCTPGSRAAPPRSWATSTGR